MDCSLWGPLSIGFFRQEYWSGLPCTSPGDLPKAGIKPKSSALQAGSLLSEPPGKPQLIFIYIYTAKHKYKVSLLWLKRNHKENGQCSQETSKTTGALGMAWEVQLNPLPCCVPPWDEAAYQRRSSIRSNWKGPFREESRRRKLHAGLITWEEKPESRKLQMND